MTQTYLASLLFLVLLGAVGTADGAYDLERPSLLEFAFDGFDPNIGHGQGKAIEKIYYRFGQARRADVRTEPDAREPGITNEVKTWYYDGLEIITSGSVLTLGRGIAKITLTSPDYKLKFGLSIGSPQEAFLEKLGPPHPTLIDTDSSMVGYIGQHSFVYIYFDKQNRAKKIVWEYSSD